MTGRTEIERALDGFFAEGPDKVADEALVRTLDAIDRTKQRRDLFARWRFNVTISFPRLAMAALVAIMAIGGGAYVLGQRSGVGGPVPTPIVTPAASTNPTAAKTPAPTPTLDPSTWATFTSAIYGFSAAHPTDWSEARTSSKSASAPGADSNADTFFSPSGWPDFHGFEIKVPAGTTADAFIQGFVADPNNCYPSPNMWFQTTVDGHPASIAYAGCNEHFFFAQAAVVVGKRVWFFVLDGPDRTLILPFLTTVKIDPTKVVD